MPKIVLSDSFIRGAEAGYYRDEDLKGFCLKVTNTGKRVFIVNTKLQGTRKNVTVTVGVFGKVTSKQARTLAKDALAKLAQGINPNDVAKDSRAKLAVKEAEKKTAKLVDDITLRRAFQDYVEAKKVKASTAYVYKCDVFKCLSDWLDVPLNAISKDAVERRHRQISESHQGQANHVMRILRAIFNYATITYDDHKGEPIIKTNPVRRLSELKVWNRLKPRQDIIADHELAAWFKAVNELELETARDYLNLLIFTGLRKVEAASLEWSNVDFQSRSLTVKDTKNHRDHTLPLTNRLYYLLQKRWQCRTNSFVFDSALSANGYVHDYRHQLKLVANKSGVPFTIHTCRRTFSSIAARMLPEYTVKRLTNHTDAADVTQTHYVVFELEKLVQPMEAISKHLEKYGKLKPVNSGKIINFRKGTGEQSVTNS